MSVKRIVVGKWFTRELARKRNLVRSLGTEGWFYIPYLYDGNEGEGRGMREGVRRERGGVRRERGSEREGERK